MWLRDAYQSNIEYVRTVLWPVGDVMSKHFHWSNPYLAHCDSAPCRAVPCRVYTLAKQRMSMITIIIFDIYRAQISIHIWSNAILRFSSLYFHTQSTNLHGINTTCYIDIQKKAQNNQEISQNRFEQFFIRLEVVPFDYIWKGE